MISPDTNIIDNIIIMTCSHRHYNMRIIAAAIFHHVFCKSPYQYFDDLTKQVLILSEPNRTCTSPLMWLFTWTKRFWYPSAIPKLYAVLFKPSKFVVTIHHQNSVINILFNQLNWRQQIHHQIYFICYFHQVHLWHQMHHQNYVYYLGAS